MRNKCWRSFKPRLVPERQVEMMLPPEAQSAKIWSGEKVDESTSIFLNLLPPCHGISSPYFLLHVAFVWPLSAFSGVQRGRAEGRKWYHSTLCPFFARFLYFVTSRTHPGTQMGAHPTRFVLPPSQPQWPAKASIAHVDAQFPKQMCAPRIVKRKAS